MNKNFYVPEKTDAREFDRVMRCLELDAQVFAELDNKDEELAFVVEMLKETKEYRGANGENMRFLMLDMPNTMPADCRVMYVYKPTYYMVGFIMKMMVKYPEDIRGIDTDFDQKFHQLLRGAMGRNFFGHGSERENGLFKSLQILALGSAGDFLKKYSDYDEGFTNCLKDSLKYYAENMSGKYSECDNYVIETQFKDLMED